MRLKKVSSMIKTSFVWLQSVHFTINVTKKEFLYIYIYMFYFLTHTRYINIRVNILFHCKDFMMMTLVFVMLVIALSIAAGAPAVVDTAVVTT